MADGFLNFLLSHGFSASYLYNIPFHLSLSWQGCFTSFVRTHYTSLIHSLCQFSPPTFSSREYTGLMYWYLSSVISQVTFPRPLCPSKTCYHLARLKISFAVNTYLSVDLTTSRWFTSYKTFRCGIVSFTAGNESGMPPLVKVCTTVFLALLSELSSKFFRDTPYGLHSTMSPPKIYKKEINFHSEVQHKIYYKIIYSSRAFLQENGHNRLEVSSSLCHHNLFTWCDAWNHRYVLSISKYALEIQEHQHIWKDERDTSK